MRGKRSRTLIVPLAVLGLGLTAMAWGHGFGRRGFHGPGGPPGGRPGGHPGMLIERLVFPCQADCFEAGRPCIDAAESTAETCAAGSCATEITTAQTACQADRTSSDLSDGGDRSAHLRPVVHRHADVGDVVLPQHPVDLSHHLR